MNLDTCSWTERPVGELIDHIVEKHHEYLRRELPALTALMSRCAALHGAHRPELLIMRQLLGDLVGELEVHLFKEEQVLFPALRRQESGLTELVQALGAEHELICNCLSRLRELSGVYVAPPPASTSLLALYAGLEALDKDLRQHISLEDEVLFR